MTNKSWRDFVGNSYDPDEISLGDFQRNRLLAVIADALEDILIEIRKEDEP